MDLMPKDKVAAGLHKPAPYPRGETVTQENHRNRDSDEQVTASRMINTEVYLQMEKLSCWGGRDQAASGTNTPGTLAFYTCLHLGVSTLKKNSKELVS